VPSNGAAERREEQAVDVWWQQFLAARAVPHATAAIVPLADVLQFVAIGAVLALLAWRLWRGGGS